MTPPLRILGPATLFLAFLLPAVAHAASTSDPAVRHATTMGSVGVARPVSDIMRAQAAMDASGERKERDREEKENGRERVDRSHLPQNPLSPFVSEFGSLVHQENGVLGTSEATSMQSIGLSFTGATLSGTNPTGSFPPDCMGAVGPTQYVVFVNGRLVTFNKTTGVADGALNADPDVFFSSVITSGGYTSDPRIRYDRLTGRWILVIIDVPASLTSNRILFAVSNAASNGTITGSTTFTYFYIPTVTTPPTISSTCFADYPTLGLDANALYIGTNDFCGASGTYNGTDAYVVRKTSILGSGPIVVTAFRQLCTAYGAGPATPQGVDNFDPSATEGYIIGSDNASHGLLQLRRISNPGGTPTISSNIPITVPATGAPVSSFHLGNTGGTNGKLDALDDRLFAAHIRGGQLWTAHNIGVNNTGVASGTLTRDASRWYQINVPVGSGTPTVVQSGTVYTASASNTTDQRNYWIPSIMVSGQGHAAMGFSAAGTNERANAGAVGRFSADAAGSMQTPALITSSSTAYNPPSDNGAINGARRWGDYSYTSLDPGDDMTMWTVGMFCNATNSYGVRVTKLVAPPPATPSALADVPAGQNPVSLTLTGLTSSGSGFYDPGANLPGVPAFSHLSASVSASGVTGTPPSVTSATYLTPTTVQLVLNASAATASVGSERYTVTVTNPDGQTAAAAVVHVVGTIPTVTIAAGPSQAEGNSGTSAFDFTVNLSSPATAPVVVRYQTADGTATVADNDYAAASDSITIAAGLSSGTVHVAVNGDTKYENNEAFTVTLTSATEATLGSTLTATGTITNDDSQPVLAMAASAGATEGDSGTAPLVFGLTLSNPSAFSVSASYATADNSATTADGDYQPASGTVTIPAGQTSGGIDVDVAGDTKYENNESFTVTLASPSGGTLGNAVATGTITNDDPMPALSIDDVEHLEGDSGTALFRFTATLSAPSGLPATVDYATADSTATVANGDYEAANGELLFPAGTTTLTLDVLARGDTTAEGDEAFVVTLGNPTSATIARSPGIGTIRNDDATPLLSLSGATALEGHSGVTPFLFTVGLSRPSGQAVTVHYATADSTATQANGDYAAASGVLTIPALETSASVTVDVAGDACGEPDEVFTLALSEAGNAAIATPVAIGTIQNDDDVTPPAVAVVAPNGGETPEVMGTLDITWTSSDSVGVTGVDILLSRDDGATFPEVLATGQPGSGQFAWAVTPPATAAARVQVRAHDAGCNAGADASDAAFEIADHVTGVEGGAPVTAFALGAVRPNPSSGAVRFGYELPRDADVRLSVMDVQGREIALITSGSVGMGRHTAVWTGATPGGQAPRGLYFVRFAAGGRMFTRRFALIR